MYNLKIFSKAISNFNQKLKFFKQAGSYSWFQHPSLTLGRGGLPWGGLWLPCSSPRPPLPCDPERSLGFPISAKNRPD